jgi:hypothetical protein
MSISAGSRSLRRATFQHLSEWTRERLGWQPNQPGLLADVDQPHYFAAGVASVA